MLLTQPYKYPLSPPIELGKGHFRSWNASQWFLSFGVGRLDKWLVGHPTAAPPLMCPCHGGLESVLWTQTENTPKKAVVAPCVCVKIRICGFLVLPFWAILKRVPLKNHNPTKTKVSHMGCFPQNRSEQFVAFL